LFEDRLRPAPPAQGRLRRLWLEWRPLVLILAAVLVSRTVVAQPFYVPSGSMEPSLEIGDELLATKYPYGFSRYSLPLDLPLSSPDRLLGRLPERGDVVVFRLPRDPEQVYVKRVIGLPGDRLQMRDGRLWINGQPLPLAPNGNGQVEMGSGERIAAERFIETLPNGREHPILKLAWGGPLNDTPEYAVPPGNLFMMGDNRDDSLDSRVSARAGGVGFVPVENLIGRADLILGSWDFKVTRQPVWTWINGLRPSRFFSRL
jgi:signal peptidase I